jgi:hypothetical protein
MGKISKYAYKTIGIFVTETNDGKESGLLFK